MTNQGDPYRILGIRAGASLIEIRSAYRRLAKQYHPDAAGERALPRFLAIQAAYERLVDGEGRLRGAGQGSDGRSTSAGGRGGSAPRDREPWRADPERARASRDAWRARRSTARDTGATDAAAGASEAPRPGPGSPPGSTSRRQRAPGGAAGAAGAAGRRDGRTASGDRPGRRSPRGPRKATPGSTTYDEAAETPRDPEWGGGAWYGPSSGTFWTINPREYADPRKHGPEYQARARRAAEGEPAPGDEREVPAMPGPVADADATAERVDLRWDGSRGTTTARGEGEWATGRWAYDAADPHGPPGGAHAYAAGDPRRAASSPPTGAGRAGPGMADLPDLEALARRASPASLLALAQRPDRRWRLMLALIGWPPIGFALGTLLSMFTGCATYTAACTEPLLLLPIAVQPVVIVALFLVGPVAAMSAFGSIVALAVALPVAAVLAVGSGPGSRAGAPLLGAAIAVAWLVAVIAGVRGTWRARPGGGRPPP